MPIWRQGRETLLLQALWDSPVPRNRAQIGALQGEPWLSSGPSGKFCNTQSHGASANQGAFRRQWPLPWQETQHRVAFAQRLPKGHATSIVGCVAVLGKGLPFPTDCVLPTMLVVRLSVTELSAWPTSHRPRDGFLHIRKDTKICAIAPQLNDRPVQ